MTETKEPVPMDLGQLTNTVLNKASQKEVESFRHLLRIQLPAMCRVRSENGEKARIYSEFNRLLEAAGIYSDSHAITRTDFGLNQYGLRVEGQKDVPMPSGHNFLIIARMSTNQEIEVYIDANTSSYPGLYRYFAERRRGNPRPSFA